MKKAAIIKKLSKIKFLKGAYYKVHPRFNQLGASVFRAYNLINYKNAQVFKDIVIETSSACNRRCRYCPVTYYPRNDLKMPEDTFYRVINQLAERHYRGEIYLNCYNEPLLDDRLPQFIKYASDKCPQSFIYLASNGDLLDLSAFKKLIQSGISLIVVTQYDKEMGKNLKELLSAMEESDKKYIEIHNGSDLNLCNRAGALKELQIEESIAYKCSRPDIQLIISAEGRAVLCCNDYFGEEVMGDVSKENVFDIWVKNRFRDIRRDLRRGKRKNIGICSRCDFPYGGYPLPRIPAARN